MFFGLACCAIEMIASFDPCFDLARFGMEISSGRLWLHGAAVHPSDYATDGRGS